ncbi:MAG: hypothetical protein R6X06_03725 [Gammaproteobacteria bacterium]
MVMRHWLMLACCLCVCTSPVLAAATFTARLSNDVIEQGKFTRLLLTTQGHASPLRAINLAPLEDHFHVDSSMETIRTAAGQQWQLRLYPRQQGRLRVPALQYGATRSQELWLEVTPAVDVKSGHRFDIHADISTHSAWPGQEVIVQVVLSSKDSHVVLESRDAEFAHGQLRHLNTVSETPAGGAPTRHTSGWVYWPTQTGAPLLELPPLRYIRDGVETHRFYLPRYALHIKPLPLYVPDNIAVGRLGVRTVSSPVFGLSQRLQQLEITLEAEGMRAAQRPRLEHYVSSQAGLEFYPATARSTEELSQTGLSSETRLQLPFRVTRTGMYQPEPVRLAYFDPHSGRLRNLEFEWPVFIFISPWLLTLLMLLGSVAVFYGVRRVWRSGVQALRRYQTRRRARRALLAATTPAEIRAALLLLSRLEDGRANTTLRRWHARRAIDIEPLNQALYGRAHYDMQILRQPYLGL